MALSALTLAVTTHSANGRYRSSIVGKSTGTNIAILFGIGFYLDAGRLARDMLPEGISSGVLRETDPLSGAFRDSPFDVTGYLADAMSALKIGTIPSVIAASGSTTIISSRTGSTFRLATNPYGAWSISGSTLSWSSAAIGTADRPTIVEDYVLPSPPTISRETTIASGFGVSGGITNTPSAPANAVLNASGGAVLNASGGFVLNATS